MKIGIDARLIMETGVGRYIRNLILELSAIDDHNAFVVYLPKKAFDTFVLPNARWKKVLAEVHWHTLAEQFVMPRLYTAEGLDLVHIPYHNPPILYRGSMVITIHDLTILHFSTGKATKLPLPIYWLKRLGYRLELMIGLKKAAGVIAVSQTTKQEIIDHFHIPKDRITVTYEGVDSRFTSMSKSAKPLIQFPYALYVGNAYPHKNIETLISAYEHYVNNAPKGNVSRLVLVGTDDYFYRRIKEVVHAKHLDEFVVFFGAASDVELSNLYTHARVFVFPSFMEGFGLPALEALSFGCPVLVSNIGIFHEILQENATYFDPKNSTELSKTLALFLTGPVQKVVLPPDASKKFSWVKMAKETLALYESSARL